MPNIELEHKGLNEYKNKGYLYETVNSCDNLIHILSQNMNEFPDMKYSDLYMLCQTLIGLKWSAIQLLGRDKK